MLAGFLILAYQAGRQVAIGVDFRLFLLGMAVLSGFVFLNPRLGLYAFCFTLILVPFGWRVEGIKLTSPNTMVIAAALMGWGASLALRRGRLQLSQIYIPLAAAMLVTWLNLLRYGRPFFNVPLIFSEAALLFPLSYHLIRTGRDLRDFLVVFGLAVTLRTVLDVGTTVSSLFAGSELGAIQSEQLLLQVAATTESEWRSLLLAFFLALVVMSRGGRSRPLYMAALMVVLAWLALAGTRTGLVGLILAPLSVLVLLPSTMRGRLLRLSVPAGLVVVLGSVVSNALPHILWKTRMDIQGGLEAGRLGLWRAASQAFLDNPLWGSGLGPSHSYVLGTGRTMGLLFLLPLAIALWMVWRHGAWLREQPLDRLSRAVVTGLQAGLLVAVPLNFIGTMFQGAVNAMFFWLLAGIQEAIYLDVRSRRGMIVPSSRLMNRGEGALAIPTSYRTAATARKTQ